MRPRGMPVLAVLAAAALVVGIAAPAHASDYPTWAEVQAAKSNAAAAQAALDRINAAVQQLQVAQEAAATAELQAADAATQAAAALQAASDKVDALDAEVTAAQKDADDARARFVSTELALDKLGGGVDLTTRLLLTPGRPDQLLDGLSTLSKLAQRAGDLEASARQKQKAAAALQAQASEAQRLRTSLKAEADQKLAAAQQAQAAAESALAAQQTQLATLYAQAATLKNTAAATQAAYYDGLAKSASSGGGSVSDLDISGVVADPAGAKAYARSAIGAYGWDTTQYNCLVSLWTVESGWRANAYNRSSGAYGIPQALPASKMQSAGADWLTNGDTQIDWGLGYIKGRYGTPCAAWAFETSHVPYWY